MRFYLNSGQTSTVQLTCGLGGDTVVRPMPPPERKRGTSEVQGTNTLAPRCSLRSLFVVPRRAYGQSCSD